MGSLYTRLFSRAVFPVLDRLNGTSICRKLELLKAAERLEREEIRSRQATKLARVIDLARRESGFYRELWQQRDREGPPSEHPLLDGIPVVTKADLARATDQFPLPGFRRKVIVSRTSGSTGSPMTFYRSQEQESWFWALRFRMWGWAGYQAGEPYLTINLNPRDQWRKKAQDILFRCSYLTYNADNQDSEQIIATLKRRGIKHLNGFSSSLYVLARYLVDRGVAAPSLVGITATGDALFPSYRETIEKAFGVQVLDYYGAGGEGLHLASQCTESAPRYHVHPENAVVEVLGAEGPVERGERGRLVVTQLDNDAMPLIRYDLEDVGVPAAAEAECACGRSLPMLEGIEGRVPDLVCVPDGTYLVMHFFVVLFKNLQSVHRYQIVQSERDRLLVRLVGRPGCSKREVERVVRGELAKATRGQLRAEFDWVDEIPLSGAGKRRLIVSEISREVLGRSSER